MATRNWKFTTNALCSIGVLFVLACVCVPVTATKESECTESTDNCWSRSGKLCNGQGVCKCGQCVCEAVYSGPTCDQCPSCVNSCERFKDCVLCKAFGTGRYGFMKCLQVCDRDATFFPVDDLDSVAGDLCQFQDEDNCVFSFKLGDAAEDFWNIHMKLTRDCPKRYEPEEIPQTTVTTHSVVEVEPVAGGDNPDADAMAGDPVNTTPAAGSRYNRCSVAGLLFSAIVTFLLTRVLP